MSEGKEIKLCRFYTVELKFADSVKGNFPGFIMNRPAQEQMIYPSLPEEKPEWPKGAHSWDDNGIIYHAAVNCPFCDYDNFFSGTLVENENMV